MKTKIKLKGFWITHPLIGVTFLYGPRVMKDQKVDLEAILQHGLYIISGNHRRQAMLELKTEFSTNPNYMRVPVLILACNDDTDSVQQLVMLGSVTNDIDHFSSAVTFPEKMFILRKEHVDAQVILNDRDRKAKLRNVKDAYARIWDIAPNTMGTHMAMVGRNEHDWEYLEKYLKGEHLQHYQKAKKRGHPAVVRSWGALVSIASLNQANFEKLMAEILRGECPMNLVTSRIRRMGADQFVRIEMLRYFGEPTWESFREHYPDTSSATYLDMCVNWVLPSSGTKYVLTKELMIDWERRKQKQQRDAALDRVCLFLVFVYFLILLSLLFCD
jgi:hypothetical protein